MRKLIVLGIAVALVLGAAGGAVALAKDAEAAKYVCTHCKVGAEKAGACPLCEAPMKKAGAYMCPACDTTADKAGTCACGKDLVKVEMAGVKCQKCGYYHAKDAKGCAVCAKHAAGGHHD